MKNTTKTRLYTMTLAQVYPLYIAKVERKGRTKADVDMVLQWLTGYSAIEVEHHLAEKTTFAEFFKHAPALNPNRSLIRGVICGVRIEDITDPVEREIRYLDKLVDEVAKGKNMKKILREPVV